MNQVTRVCHISSVHYSLDTRILHRECVSLVQHGYEVHFLVLNQETKIVKGVHIHSIEVPIKNRLDRMRRSPEILFEKALELDASIYHFHDPELLRLGRKLQQAGKIAIYDSHEHVPHQIRTKKYLSPLLRIPIAWIFEKFENRMVKKMDAVVTATDLVRARFLSINKKTIEVNNYPRVDAFTVSKKGHEVKKVRDVTYVGLINDIRGINEMLDALDGADWKLCLVGYFETASLENRIRQHRNWKKVDFVGRKNRAEVAQILAESKIGIVTFLPAPNHNKNQPNKLFEYMAAGLPVVCSHFERWQKIVDRAACGLCVDPAEPKAINEAVEHLLSQTALLKSMAINARKSMEKDFNWSTEEARLVGLYQQLLKEA